MSSSNLHYPTRAVSLTEHPASLPEADIADTVNHAAIAASAVAYLSDLSVNALTDNAIWRDCLALTGTLRTLFSPEVITSVWTDLARKHRPASFVVEAGSSRIVRLSQRTVWVEANFRFELQGERPAQCSGIIGLVPPMRDAICEDGKWRIWLLSTILERPRGWPDVDDLRPLPETSTDSPCGGVGVSSCLTVAPDYVDCLVVGGGISGLCMAGRLQALGLAYLVVEKRASVGDTWLKERYESIKLHTSKEYCQLPGLPRVWRWDDPYHLDAAHLANGFKRYVNAFGINMMTSTTLVTAKWMHDVKCWRLSLLRDGVPFDMRARHVVLAVGSMGTTPNIPQLRNRQLYQGEVFHDQDWRNAMPWKGKAGVVVGSANTAQWIITSMAVASLKTITMIQRTKTFVLPTSTLSGLLDPIYNEQTPTETSDRMLLAYPLPVQRLMAMMRIVALADQKPEYFDRIFARG